MYNLCKYCVCEQTVRHQRGTLPFPGILFCLEKFLFWRLRMWVECQLVHTVRQHSATSAASSANHHREEVPALFLLRSPGQLVPGQLHGCRVAGKEPVLGKPRRGFCICSAVEPPTPTPPPFSLCPPPSPSALHQLRPAGETAGRCCRRGERRVRVCLCACFKWSRGRSHGWHHCQRDAFKHMHTGVCKATLFWTWSLAATLRCFC